MAEITVTHAAVFTAIGGAGLKLAEMAVKAFGLSKSIGSSELAQTMKAGAELRDELRRDNEALRERVDDLEKRVNVLERDLSVERAVTAKLGDENEELKARVRIAERAASR